MHKPLPPLGSRSVFAAHKVCNLCELTAHTVCCIMLYFNTQITGWQLLKLIRTVCYKMLLRGAKSRVLCYNKLRAIACPLRQQHLSTFLTNYKQLNHTYTF